MAYSVSASVFLPLVAMPAVALVTRRHVLWLGLAAGVALGLGLCGEHWLPRHLGALARRRAYEHSHLEMMRGYAECPDCRRRYLLNYFGEEYGAERCGHCDDALVAPAELAAAPAAEADGPFAVNDRVVHAT